MGYKRRRPERLAEKLLQIRTHLGVTQAELVRRLGVGFDATYISKFELGKNEPDMMTVLAYARLVKVPLEQIVDDQLDLELP